MNSGFITSQQKTITRDYRDVVIHDFFEITGNSATHCASGDVVFLYNTASIIVDQIKEAKETLLIATSALDSAEIVDALNQKISQNDDFRIYLLLDMASESTIAVRSLIGKSYIRSGVKQAGSILLIDPKNEPVGLFFTGNLSMASLDSNGEQAVLLDNDQVRKFYQNFCHLFWDQATHELFQEKHLEKPATAKESPFPNVHLSDEYFHADRLTPFFERETNSNREALLVTPAFTQELPFASSKIESDLSLLTPLRKNDERTIKELSQKGCRIHALEENNHFRFVLYESDGYLIPALEDSQHYFRWILQLNEGQRQEYQDLWQSLFDKAPYHFIPQKNVAEINREILTLNGLKPFRKLNQIQSELPDYYLESIESFEHPNPDQLTRQATRFSMDLFADSVEFSFRIHPPYLPKNAREDRLHSDWDSVESQYQKKLLHLRENIHKLDEKQNSIGDKIRGLLLGMFLGNRQKSKEWGTKLDRLETILLARSSQLEREDIQEEIDSMLREIGEKHQETDLEIDKNNQRVAWEEKKEELEQSKNGIENSVRQKKESLKAAETEYQKRYNEKKMEARQQREEYCQALSIDSNNWKQKLQDLEQLEKPSKKRKNEQKHKYQNAREELRQIERYHSLNTELKRVKESVTPLTSELCQLWQCSQGEFATREELLLDRLKVLEATSNLDNEIEEELRQIDWELNRYEVWQQEEKERFEAMETLKREISTLLEALNCTAEELPEKKRDLEQVKNVDSWQKEIKHHLSKMRQIDRILPIFEDSQKPQLEKRRADLTSEEKRLSAKQEDLKTHGDRFVYKSSANGNKSSLGDILSFKKRNKKNRSNSGMFTFPSEELPAEGTRLHRDYQQRWLLVSTYEQLNQAKEDATRLNAKICIMEENKNG